MQTATQVKIWLGLLAAFIIVLVALKAVLLPFVAGMGIAYLLDPLCDRIESWGCSRKVATSLVTAIFALVIVIVLLFLVPLALDEAVAFFSSLPEFLSQLEKQLLPSYQQWQTRFNLPDVSELSGMAQARLGGALAWLGSAIQGIFNRGLALANLLSLLFITPIVTFYLLLDWDPLIKRIDHLLPRDYASIIRSQACEMDRTLSGFVRGQSMVCLVLALYYAAALSLTGVQFGMVIGILSGLLTFVPYVGAMTGFLLAMIVVLVEGDSWAIVGIVVGIFALGQVIEGNFLTPRLVGSRIGLHPVWVIFALLSGGALFGFVGLLLALPVAALIGVLVRFAMSNYLASHLYLGKLEKEEELIADSNAQDPA